MQPTLCEINVVWLKLWWLWVWCIQCSKLNKMVTCLRQWGHCALFTLIVWSVTCQGWSHWTWQSCNGSDKITMPKAHVCQFKFMFPKTVVEEWHCGTEWHQCWLWDGHDAHCNCCITQKTWWINVWQCFRSGKSQTLVASHISKTCCMSVVVAQNWMLGSWQWSCKAEN